MMLNGFKVMVLEDEELLVEVLADVLESLGVRAHYYRTYTSALEVPEVDLAFVDQSLPDGRGSDLIPILRQRYPKIKLILMTGHPLSSFTPAIQQMVDGVLVKPFTVEEFEDMLHRQLEPE